jgi:hypothetical protein
MSRKYAENTRGKPFAAGNPGKPKGARHRVTLAIEALLEGEAEELTRAVIEKAKAGDVTALRLCLERLAPARKDSPISLVFPSVRSAADTVDASAMLLEAVTGGEVSPGEAASVMALLVSHKTILETGDLERRVADLEAKGSAK